MAESIIKIESISKFYKNRERAVVEDLTLEISKKEIFGLLGPNGAGKTTTLSILTGLLEPTAGKVFINGLSLENDFSRIKPMIGVVPQSIALYEKLTANENLVFFGKMYGISGQELKSRIDYYLNLFSLASNANQITGTFSEGMKRRLNVIAGILHQPQILILDEPTVAIDIHSKKIILDHLLKMNEQGATIVYTSHQLSEAEKFCTRVAIMDKGKIICQGMPQELITANAAYTDLESVFLDLTEHALTDAR